MPVGGQLHDQRETRGSGCRLSDPLRRLSVTLLLMLESIVRYLAHGLRHART